jgi:parvulin-like peptidyl-prolyl isomerase
MPPGRARAVRVGLVVLTLLVAEEGCRPGDGPPADADGEALATFDGRRLTRRDVVAELALLSARQRSYLTTPERKRQFVENLALNELLYAEGRKLGFDDDDVERQVADLRKRLVVQRVLARYREAPVLTDDALRAHYDENPGLYSGRRIRASHIRVADARSAHDILAEVRAHPERFADLARARSNHTASAARGGDLGTFGPGTMELEFDRAAFALAPGEIAGEVVETRDGYHVIMVTERQEGTRRPFEEVREAIRTRLRNHALSEGVRLRLAELRREVPIEVNEEALARLDPARVPPAPGTVQPAGH